MVQGGSDPRTVVSGGVVGAIGADGTVNMVTPRRELVWPVVVGSPPPLASAFQERDVAVGVDDTAEDGGVASGDVRRRWGRQVTDRGRGVRRRASRICGCGWRRSLGTRSSPGTRRRRSGWIWPMPRWDRTAGGLFLGSWPGPTGRGWWCWTICRTPPTCRVVAGRAGAGAGDHAASGCGVVRWWPERDRGGCVHPGGGRGLPGAAARPVGGSAAGRGAWTRPGGWPRTWDFCRWGWRRRRR